MPLLMKKMFQDYQLAALAVLWLLLFTGHQMHAQRYPAVFDPTTIPFNGINGFAIPGLDATQKMGNEVQFIGDINNDGIEDFAIGNSNETVGALNLAGRAFIIFGSISAFPTTFDLTTLDGSNGFVVEGVSFNERRGATIAGPGDINGDGIDDLIIGSSNSSADEIVLYGSTTFPALITVNDINGTNGFLIDTPGSRQVAALGDVNGDNIDDFIIATPHWSGQSWVIFGRSSNYPALLDISWLDGINGFRIGDFAGSRPAYFAGGAGDINNDGFNDMLIGNWASSGTDQISYALFGKNTPFDVLVDIEAVDGTDGFLIDNQGNHFLTYVGPIGDINNDGIDDCFSENNIILGSSTTFPDSLFMVDLDGSNGFVLNSMMSHIAPAGDLNMDGVDDFIVGGNDYFVVFGTTGGFSSTFDPSTVDGINGFKISNVTGSGIGGRFIDGGKDINGDGLADFIFGDLAGTGNNTGMVYVVFGGDFVAPTITCPGNQQLTCTDTVIPDYTSLATATDTEDPSPTITQSPVAGFAFTDGMTITLTATDASGNASSCTFTVQDVDAEAPVIDCTPTAPITVGTTIGDYTGLLTSVTDNCDPSPVIAQSPLPGSPFVNGMTITLTATDATGNFSYCEYIITVTPDTTPPVITTCPGNQQLTCTDSTIPDYTGLATATDNEDPNPTITQSPVAGSAFTDGMTITLTATDASGNASSCTFTVQDVDAEAPVIDCTPTAPITVGTTISDYTGLITSVTDNCDPSPVITQSPLPGSPFVNGMTITLTATDATGNFSYCEYIINVDTPPTITCPANQDLTCTDTVIPDYTSLATATDAEDPNPAITQSPAVGSTFTDGMTITLTATDDSGNASSCTFTVNLLADVTAPVPDLTTLTAITAECSVTSLTAPTATDNCSATVTVTNNAALPITTSGTTTITWTYDDGNGNTSTQTQDVIITDVTAPVPNLTTLTAITAECSVTALTAPTATDNCSATVMVTNNATLPITTSGTTTITWTYDDGNGNTSTQTQDVIITDAQPPAITCPVDQQLAFGATVPDYTGMATVTDNCDLSPVVTQSPAVGTAFTNGMTITLTATDASGNPGVCTFVVNQLADTTDPAISCPANQDLTCADTVIPDYANLATATDTEDPSPIITQSPAVGSTFTDGMAITLTATDASGNASSCTFTVTIDEVLFVDAGDDIDIIEGESTQLNASSNMSGTYSWSPSFSLDASDIASPIASPEITTTYEVIFTSDDGCVGKDNLTVFVEESEGIYKNKYGFSPDGDGINEVWKIDKIENYPNNRVVIYNRWSDKVYEISGYDNIAKVFNGEANRMTSLGAGNLPEGTYYFKIELNQGEEVISGYLVLKR